MKTAFIISGILGVVVWPFIMLPAIMLMDSPGVPLGVEILRRVAVYSALLTPVIWVVAVICAVLESKRKKRPKNLRAYAAAPYAAAGVHVLSLVVLFTLPQ